MNLTPIDLENRLTLAQYDNLEVGSIIVSSRNPDATKFVELSDEFTYAKAAYPDLATKVGNLPSIENLSQISQQVDFIPTHTSYHPVDGKILIYGVKKSDSTPADIVITSTDGVNFDSVATTINSYITDVHWAEFLSKFYIASGLNQLKTSNDGITIDTSSAFGAPLTQFASSATYMVAATSDGSILRYNGTTWEYGTVPEGIYDKVIWAGGTVNLFVAWNSSASAAGDPTIITSSDGLTWTTRQTYTSTAWEDIAFSPTLGFVAKASNAYYATSADGITWSDPLTDGKSGYTITWLESHSVFVSAYGDYHIFDGTSWSSIDPGISNSLSDLKAPPLWVDGLDKFYAVKSGDVLTSVDGTDLLAASTTIEINTIPNPGEAEWQSTTWSPDLDLFVSVASNASSDKRVRTSTDGTTWTEVATGNHQAWNSVAWSSSLGLFAAVSSDGDGTQVMTSPDGSTWTLRTTPAIPAYATSSEPHIVWASGISKFVIVNNRHSMVSSDGINWSISGEVGGLDNTANGVLWVNDLGIFIAGHGVTSTDGLTWTDTHDLFSYSAPPFAYFKGRLYAGHWEIFVSDDSGQTWKSMTLNGPGSLGSFLNVNDEYLIGFGSTNSITTDGINWKDFSVYNDDNSTKVVLGGGAYSSTADRLVMHGSVLGTPLFHQNKYGYDSSTEFLLPRVTIHKPNLFAYIRALSS